MSTTLQSTLPTEYGSPVDQTKRRAGPALPTTTADLGPTGSGCRLIERHQDNYRPKVGAPVRWNWIAEVSP